MFELDCKVCFKRNDTMLCGNAPVIVIMYLWSRVRILQDFCKILIQESYNDLVRFLALESYKILLLPSLSV